MADTYSRPKDGERFLTKGGLRTGAAVDAYEVGQYPVLQNVRGFSPTELSTRAGLGAGPSTATGSSSPVLNIASYSTQGTGDTKRFLIASGGDIYLDTAANVDSGYSPFIPSMVPYRPNASPSPWMYVSDANQYRKLRAPDTTNAVLAQNVGIPEPSSPVQAAVYESYLTPLTAAVSTPNYTLFGNGHDIGTAVRTSDTVAAVYQDPALPSGALNEYIVQTTSTTQAYQVNQDVAIGYDTGDGTNSYMIREVFQPIPTPITIAAITMNGNRAIIVPSNIGVSTDFTSEGGDLYNQTILGSLRRGALVTIGGTETCMVLGTALGRDGSISFEAITTLSHNAGDTITTERAFRVLGSSVYNGGTPRMPLPGDNISASNIIFTVDAGTGGIESHIGVQNPFAYNQIAYQNADYIQLSIQVQHVANVNEIKILLDVSDNSAGDAFLTNYYFHTLRPADITLAVSNKLTQLGAAGIAQQRAQLAEEVAAGAVPASQQTTTGDNQWSDILIPISAFTRVGSDQTKSLLNLNAFQLLVNANAPTGIGFHALGITGGFSADIGQFGQPYEYRIRPRSSITGAKGNPSPKMRYKVSPRRELVKVILPTTYPDSQVDYWDIFRLGGTVDSERKVGTVPMGTAEFLDNYSDLSIQTADTLDLDNLEPWPTIDLPFAVSNATAVGTIIRFETTVASAPAANIARYLPGNLVQIGQQTYTINSRPIITGTTVTMEIVENAGFQYQTSLTILEPLMAKQELPAIWGPTAEGGTIFGAGDPYRPGNVYFAKNFNPDSVPSAYNVELSPPSEPLTGGAILNGLGLTCTVERWWQLRPTFSAKRGPNQYTPQSLPVGRGALSQACIATDGKAIYFISYDGVYATNGGPAIPLVTKDDLYTLFPHDGLPGMRHEWAGVEIYPPDYTNQSTFSLSHTNGFLRFSYLDTQGVANTLVLDLVTKSWYLDNYSQAIRSTLAIPKTNTVLLGDSDGNVYTETFNSRDAGVGIIAKVGTRENPGGDLRAETLFGDAGIDLLPTSVVPLLASPVEKGQIVAAATPFQSQLRITQGVIDLAGGMLLSSLGFLFSWETNGEPNPVTLYSWNLATIDKPETTVGRFTDWDSPSPGAMFVQGFVMEADTMGSTKSFLVRDSDTLTPQQTFTRTFNGQSEIAFSFTTPFIAHSIRIEPIDSVPWRLFGIRWIFEPYPEKATVYRSEATSNFTEAYNHILLGQIAYISPTPVNLILRRDTGAPITVTLPPGGAGLEQVKRLVRIPAFKWKIISFEANSSQPFYLFQDDSYFWYKSHGSTGPYQIMRPFGSNSKAAARV